MDIYIYTVEGYIYMVDGCILSSWSRYNMERSKNIFGKKQIWLNC